MKLVIQIPCLNEEGSLAKVISAIPESFVGVESVSILVIDDGSTDSTAQVARDTGIVRLIQHERRLGLAASFERGLEEALAEGADVIVNIDGDFQYDPEDIAAVIQPVLVGEAGMVIGDRKPQHLRHFRPLKRALHWLGCKTVSLLCGRRIPDATCGLRAFSRNAAERIHLRERYTYTLETIFQLAGMGIAIDSVPVRAYETLRPSRLIRSNTDYILRSAKTIIRSLWCYQPRRALALILLCGLLLFVFWQLLRP